MSVQAVTIRIKPSNRKIKKLINSSEQNVNNVKRNCKPDVKPFLAGLDNILNTTKNFIA